MVKQYTMADIKELPTDPVVRHAVIRKIVSVPNFICLEGKPVLSELTKMFDPENLFYLTGDEGIIAFLQIVPDESAEYTATFWDQKLKGKEEVSTQLIHAIKDRLNLKYVFCKVDIKRPTLIAFAKRVGFSLYETEPDWVYMRME